MGNSQSNVIKTVKKNNDEFIIGGITITSGLLSLLPTSIAVIITTIVYYGAIGSVIIYLLYYCGKSIYQLLKDAHAYSLTREGKRKIKEYEEAMRNFELDVDSKPIKWYTFNCPTGYIKPSLGNNGTVTILEKPSTPYGLYVCSYN